MEVSNSYKVCTPEPEGEDEDTWAKIEAKWIGNFWLEAGKEIIGGCEGVELKLIENAPIIA